LVGRRLKKLMGVGDAGRDDAYLIKLADYPAGDGLGPTKKLHLAKGPFYQCGLRFPFSFGRALMLSQNLSVYPLPVFFL